MSNAIYNHLGHGITCIDAQYIRPGLAACYLLQHQKFLVFIETGTNNTVPLMLELLETYGFTPQDVNYIIPTHVHLDHAGGAGALMNACPNAQLVIHPRGARHMIDPSILCEGAISVYGKPRFSELYGDIIPVPATRIIEADDDFRLNLDDRELIFMDSPGHAKHHFCIYDTMSEGIFTGDTFGISYREFDYKEQVFVIPASTPVQFDPYAWHQTLDHIMSFKPTRLYLTHYGMLQDVNAAEAMLRHQLDAYAEIGLKVCQSNGEKQAYKDAIEKITLETLMKISNPNQKTLLPLLDFDIELNAQGLEVWAQRQ